MTSVSEEMDENTGKIRLGTGVLFEPGEVVELRAFKDRTVTSGYFDNFEKLTEQAARLDSKGFAVYVTLNPTEPALLARAHNRVKAYPKATTSDTNITWRRWLPVDLDPVRPTNVSSTDEEKQTAVARGREIREHLGDRGWPEPVMGDSGNGAHLLYKVDLPNDRESLELVKGVLESLSFKFSDESVSVDTSTANAARIWKLYGTTARKGDDTEDRPHRRSMLIDPREDIWLRAVDREQLQAVAAMRPSPPLQRSGPRRNGQKDFDLDTWIRKHCVPVRRESAWQRDAYRYVLEKCPWNGHTDNAAFIVRFANGAIAAGCHHNSCEGYGWQELRAHYEPDANEQQRTTCEEEGAGDLEKSESKKYTQARRLIRYAEDADLFRTPDGEAHATIRVANHKETWALRSQRFTQWLLKQFYEETGKAPSAQALSEARATIGARAIFDGPERPVFTRVAKHDSSVYLDLCNDSWEAVEITPTGWHVLPDPPVTFIRKDNAAALPHPASGGNVAKLRPLLNIRTEEDFRLLVSWLIGALNPEGPYPVLVLQGEQGSAKSTTVRVLRAVVDPAVEPLRAPPRDERDLAIAASGNWTPALDNLSGVRPWLSDALCRLATGGGFATRELYSDDREVLFSQKRPVILNGIDRLAVAGDLRDRSLIVELPPIPPAKKRTEREFYRQLEETRPLVLGALLDAVSAALRNLDLVELEELPRMADFAVWVTAAEEALGWEPGAFIETYAGNRTEATELTLDNDPLAGAVRTLLKDQSEWTGTSTQLLAELGSKVADDVKHSPSWSKSPNALTNRLKRLAPALRECGIEYEDYRASSGNRRRIKRLRKLPEKIVPTVPTVPADGKVPQSSAVERDNPVRILEGKKRSRDEGLFNTIPDEIDTNGSLRDDRDDRDGEKRAISENTGSWRTGGS